MRIRIIYLILCVLSSALAKAQGEDADELFRKASVLKKESKCTEAIPLLKKAVALKPFFPEAFYEMGWCYNELHQYSEALPVLQKGLTQSPDNMLIVYEIGLAKKHTGQFNEALTDFNTVLQKTPAFAQAYIARGDLFREHFEKPQDAVKDYLKAIETDTSSPKAHYWAGWCYNDLGFYEKAVPLLKKAVIFDAENHLTWTELGFSYYSLQQHDLALQQLLKANEIKPKFEMTVYYLGLCYVKKSMKAEAVKKYNELVMMGSEFAINLLAEIKNMK